MIIFYFSVLNKRERGVKQSLMNYGVLFNKKLERIILHDGYNQILSRSFIPKGVELIKRRR